MKWNQIFVGVFAVVGLMSCTQSSMDSKNVPQYGGEISGNGGNGIFCLNPETGEELAESLDLYEARELRKMDLSLGDEEQAPLAKVENFLERLSRKDPSRAKTYLNEARSFFENVDWLEGGSLPDTRDYGYVPIPPNCKIQAIVIRRNGSLEREKKFVASKSLWSKLNNIQKAALILHEIIYGDALRLGHKNSIGTRYLVGLIVSSEFTEMDSQKYEATNQKLNFIPEEGDKKDNEPYWIADEITLSTFVGNPYKINLRLYANDPDAKITSLTAKNIPEGLHLDPLGTLKGSITTPGTYLFQVILNTSTAVSIASIKMYAREKENQRYFFVMPLEKLFWADLRMLTGLNAYFEEKEFNTKGLKIVGSSFLVGVPDQHPYLGTINFVLAHSEEDIHEIWIDTSVAEFSKYNTLSIKETSWENFTSFILNHPEIIKTISETSDLLGNVKGKVMKYKSLDIRQAYQGMTVLLGNEQGDIYCPLILRHGENDQRRVNFGRGDCFPLKNRKIINDSGSSFFHPSQLEVDTLSADKPLPTAISKNETVKTLLQSIDGQDGYKLKQVIHNKSVDPRFASYIEGYSLLFTSNEDPEYLHQEGDCPDGVDISYQFIEINLTQSEVSSVGRSPKAILRCKGDPDFPRTQISK